MHEELMQIVRRVSKESGCSSSLIVSPAKNVDVQAVRRRCMAAILAEYPDLAAVDFAEVFGFTIKTARYWMVMAMKGEIDVKPTRAPWPKTPVAIVREHVARLTKGEEHALFTGVRTKEIVAIRWMIVHDVYARCPGVRPGDIARLLKVDRSSIMYAIGKTPKKKNRRTRSAPDNREQKRTNTA